MGSLLSTGGIGDFVREVLAVAREENVSFMAGSLAYYAFVSLFPLSALVVLALALLGGGALVDRVSTLVGATLSPLVDAFLGRAVGDGDVPGAVGASLVGVLALVWGSTRLFLSLHTAFAEIYDTEGEETVLDDVVDGVVVLVSVPAVLLAAVVGTTLLSVVAVAWSPVTAPLLLVVGLSAVFLPVYYVLPDADVSLREVLPGVVVAAVGWVLLQQLFGAYVALTGASAGSAIGAAVLFLTWLYFAGAVLLVGCVVNAVHGGYHSAVGDGA